MATIKIGQIINDRFEIIKELGRGGMGVTFLAKELTLGRHVVIKTLIPNNSDADRTRLIREAKILSSIRHTNIVQVFQLGFVQGTPYLCMEYIEGQSLRQLLNERGRLSIEQAKTLIVQISLTLAELHNVGILHRDLKPENIMLLQSNFGAQSNLEPIIIDFGLSKTKVIEADGTESLTKTGSLLGTIHYMSPEQGEGKDATITSEIYSLGCILYELLTGETPFSAENPIAVLYKHRTAERPLASQKSSDLKSSPGIDQIVLKALAIDPEARYSSMQDLSRAITELDSRAEFGSLMHFRGALTLLKNKRIALVSLFTGVALLLLCVLSFDKSNPGKLQNLTEDGKRNAFVGKSERIQPHHRIANGDALEGVKNTKLDFYQLVEEKRFPEARVLLGNLIHSAEVQKDYCSCRQLNMDMAEAYRKELLQAPGNDDTDEALVAQKLNFARKSMAYAGNGYCDSFEGYVDSCGALTLALKDMARYGPQQEKSIMLDQAYSSAKRSLGALNSYFDSAVEQRKMLSELKLSESLFMLPTHEHLKAVFEEKIPSAIREYCEILNSKYQQNLALLPIPESDLATVKVDIEKMAKEFGPHAFSVLSVRTALNELLIDHNPTDANFIMESSKDTIEHWPSSLKSNLDADQVHEQGLCHLVKALLLTGHFSQAKHYANKLLEIQSNNFPGRLYNIAKVSVAFSKKQRWAEGDEYLLSFLHLLNHDFLNAHQINDLTALQDAYNELREWLLKKKEYLQIESVCQTLSMYSDVKQWSGRLNLLNLGSAYHETGENKSSKLSLELGLNEVWLRGDAENASRIEYEKKLEECRESLEHDWLDLESSTQTNFAFRQAAMLGKESQ